MGGSCMDTCMAICKIASQGKLPCDSGNSNNVSDSVTVWSGGMGKEIQEGGDMGAPMAESC